MSAIHGTPKYRIDRAYGSGVGDRIGGWIVEDTTTSSPCIAIVWTVADALTVISDWDMNDQPSRSAS
jgi:hypothetical protein